MFHCSFAQSTDAVEVPLEQKATETATDFFTIVEVMPAYPGGDEALKKYVADNTNYPAEAFAQHKEGVVFVSYIVEADGTISSAKVVRGVTPELDAEALRVVKSIIGYSPGMQRGQAVRVQYVIPVRFQI